MRNMNISLLKYHWFRIRRKSPGTGMCRPGSRRYPLRPVKKQLYLKLPMDGV